MRRVGFEIAFSIIALSCLMTILQTDNLFYYIKTHPLFKFFILGSIPLMGVWLFLSIRDYIHRKGIFYYCVQKFRSLQIPKAAKYLIAIVVFGNFLCISFGEGVYPFYDVGMFRWSTSARDYDKVLSQHKYYYWQDGRFKILDLRKEGTFLAEHFGASYTEEFTFAARFRNRGEQKNFEFLKEQLQERGVDTLWVGVHSVNFETGEVSFDPDICNAVALNQRDDLYYGPIFIPEYQMMKCGE